MNDDKTRDRRHAAGRAAKGSRLPRLGWALLLGFALDGQPGRAVGQPAEADDTADVSRPPVRATETGDAASAPDVEALGTGDLAEDPLQAGEAAAVDPVVETPGTGLFEQSLAGGTAESPDTGQALPAGFDLDGYVRSDVFVGQDPDADRGVLQAGYGELSLQIRGPREPYGSAYAEVRMRYGQQLDQRDLILDFREAYVDLYAGPVDLRLGQQIIVWGRADAFNPTNNLMPFDLRIRSPIEDDRRVGNLAARVHYDLASLDLPVRLEAVWVPLYRAVESPPVDPPEYVVLTEPSFPDQGLGDGLGAVRAHLELPAFEASVSYLYGSAPLPGIALRGYTVGREDPQAPQVRVGRTSYAQHVVGMDFSTALSDLVALRAEAALRLPVEYETRVQAPRPDLQYVLGADRAFGPVTVIAQYMGRVVFDWQRELGPDMRVTPLFLLEQELPLSTIAQQEITSQIEETIAANNQVLFSQLAQVQHLLTARVEWLTLHDTLSLSALGLVNLTTEEWLLFPKLDYRISDALRAYVGAELFVGPEGTVFDWIDEKLTAVYAELRYTF